MGNCTYEYQTTGHRVSVEYPGEPMHHYDFRTLTDARRFAAGYEGRDCEVRVRPIAEPWTTCHDCGAYFHGLPYGAHGCEPTTWRIGACAGGTVSYVYVDHPSEQRALEIAAERFAATCKRYDHLTIQEA